jgi:hypothetical protein
VRRGIDADPPAGFLQRGGDQGDDAALPVGTRDVNGGIVPVGVAQLREQSTRSGEAELDGGGTGEKKIAGLGLGQHTTIVSGER